MTGPELVDFMERGGWSVGGLATALDISPRTIWRWRSGDVQMPAVWDRVLPTLRTPKEKRRLGWRRKSKIA